MRPMGMPGVHIQASRICTGVLEDDLEYLADLRWEGTGDVVKSVVCQRSRHAGVLDAVVLVEGY